MAVFNNKGCRIVDAILINGYCRQKPDIPIVLQRIIFNFWFAPLSDDWDQDFLSADSSMRSHVHIDRQQMFRHPLTEEARVSTVYGKRIIEYPHSHTWVIETQCDLERLTLLVTPPNERFSFPHALPLHRDQRAFWCLQHPDQRNRLFMADNFPHIFNIPHAMGIPFHKKGTILKVRLKTKQGSLKLIINGRLYGGFTSLKGKSYRLGVSLYHTGDAVKFL